MRGILFAVLGMTSTGVGAWYLPGIAVHDYEPSEQVWLKINSLTSAKRHVPEGRGAAPGRGRGGGRAGGGDATFGKKGRETARP